MAAPRLESVWRRSLPTLHSFRVSPSGEAVGVIHNDGRLHCLDRSGNLKWGVTFAKPPHVFLSNRGNAALSYVPQNPFLTTVALVGQGAVRMRMELEGPIACGAITPDGRLAGAATGTRRLYLFRRSGRRFTHTRQQLNGAPRAMLAPRSGLLVIGFRGEAGVMALDADGKRRWSLPGEPGRVYDLCSSPDGHMIGILSYLARGGGGIHAYVVASSGSMIWQASLPGIYPRMALESDNARAAIGYTEVLKGAGKTGYARKIAYFDATGNLLWKKGGLFFSPKLLGAVSPGPALVTQGPASVFYLLGKGGRIEKTLRYPVALRRAEASWSGRVVAAWAEDDSLYLLRWKR